MVDFLDLKSKISKHFIAHEALWLPSWKVYHKPTEQQQDNILRMARKMDIIREYVERPIKVHIWIRPEEVICDNPEFNGKNYNDFVGGAKGSTHRHGLACDWSCGQDCDRTRYNLQFIISELGVRMERLPGAFWVHNDLKEVTQGQQYYFIP